MMSRSVMLLIAVFAILQVCAGNTLQPRETLQCTASNAKITDLRSAFSEPLLFCMWWQTSADSQSILPTLTNADISQVCKCGLASPTLLSSSSTSATAVQSVAGVKGLSALLDATARPLAFCRWWLQTAPRKTSPFSIIAPRDVSTMCQAVVDTPSILLSTKGLAARSSAKVLAAKSTAILCATKTVTATKILSVTKPVTLDRTITQTLVTTALQNITLTTASASPVTVSASPVTLTVGATSATITVFKTSVSTSVQSITATLTVTSIQRVTVTPSSTLIVTASSLVATTTAATGASACAAITVTRWQSSTSPTAQSISKLGNTSAAMTTSSISITAPSLIATSPISSSMASSASATPTASPAFVTVDTAFVQNSLLNGSGTYQTGQNTFLLPGWNFTQGVSHYFDSSNRHSVAMYAYDSGNDHIQNVTLSQQVSGLTAGATYSLTAYYDTWCLDSDCEITASMDSDWIADDSFDARSLDGDFLSGGTTEFVASASSQLFSIMFYAPSNTTQSSSTNGGMLLANVTITGPIGSLGSVNSGYRGGQT